jgi:hypothetical protein
VNAFETRLLHSRDELVECDGVHGKVNAAKWALNATGPRDEKHLQEEFPPARCATGWDRHLTLPRTGRAEQPGQSCRPLAPGVIPASSRVWAGAQRDQRRGADPSPPGPRMRPAMERSRHRHPRTDTAIACRRESALEMRRLHGSTSSGP